jgi:hypothetical protein
MKKGMLEVGSGGETHVTTGQPSELLALVVLDIKVKESSPPITY